MDLSNYTEEEREVYMYEQVRMEARVDEYIEAKKAVQAAEAECQSIDARTHEAEWVKARTIVAETELYFEAVKAAM